MEPIKIAIVALIGLLGIVVFLIGLTMLWEEAEGINLFKKKDKANEKDLLCKIAELNEYIELQSRAMKSYAIQLSAYKTFVENKDTKQTITPIEKPVLRPAWQTHIISEHGVDSKDWKTYNEQISLITTEIQQAITRKSGETYIDWIIDLYGCLNESTRFTLKDLGYTVSDYLTEYTRISW